MDGLRWIEIQMDNDGPSCLWIFMTSSSLQGWSELDFAIAHIIPSLRNRPGQGFRFQASYNWWQALCHIPSQGWFNCWVHLGISSRVCQSLTKLTCNEIHSSQRTKPLCSQHVTHVTLMLLWVVPSRLRGKQHLGYPGLHPAQEMVAWRGQSLQPGQLGHGTNGWGQEAWPEFKLSGLHDNEDLEQPSTLALSHGVFWV